MSVYTIKSQIECIFLIYTVIPPIVNHVFTRMRLAQSKIIIKKKFFQIIKI
jgi:hypothetical protein